MSVRARHLTAYAAAMFSLMLLQILTTLVADKLSYYHLEIFYTLLSQVFCMGIVPLVVLLILRRKVSSVSETFRYLRYRKPKDTKVTVLASLGIVAAIVPFTMAFNALGRLVLTIIGYKSSVTVGTIYGGVGDLFLSLFLTAVLPALFEEFSHRGVLLSGLEDRGSEKTAIILSAVLFGLMHENPSQMVFTTFGGIVFGIAVVKTGSLIPGIIGHFANNAISVLLDYSTQRKTKFGVWYDAVSSRNNALSLLLTVFIMAAAVYAIVLILQYLARKSEKPVSERKILGLIPVDGFNPNGKPTLKDNISLYAVMIAESCMLLFLLIWGILR